VTTRSAALRTENKIKIRKRRQFVDSLSRDHKFGGPATAPSSPRSP